MADNKKELPTNDDSVMRDDPVVLSRCVFKESINKYINLLNSQMDSFPIIINTLAANVMANANRFSKFLNNKDVKIEDNKERKEITYKVPIEFGKEFERVQNKLSHSIK